MKFSILIPAYNVENYINKCIESVIKQNYRNFEIIIIDDASTDKTSMFIEDWARKYSAKIFYFKHERNMQISITRNELIERASGDYFIFVDSDDTINSNLLNYMEKLIVEDKEPDLVHYGIQHVDEFGNKLNVPVNLVEFHNEIGTKAFSILYRNYNVLESPCIYAYKKSYFKAHNFKYSEYRNHEDFGLTPLIILKAKTISSISKIGYYYHQKSDSIMRHCNTKRIIKNANDLLYHYDFLVDNTKEFFIDINIHHDLALFLTNALFYKARTLPRKEQKNFLLELKKRNVSKIYYPFTTKEKIRHFVMKSSYFLYLDIQLLLQLL